jgi:hypothetical protein
MNADISRPKSRLRCRCGGSASEGSAALRAKAIDDALANELSSSR